MTEAEAQHNAMLAASAQRLAETEAVVANLGQAIARIERERARVRPEDWDTLFRQLRDATEALATHPFLRGDVHAEMLISRLAGAADLADFDCRVDALGDYIAAKLSFNAALAAARDGTQPDPAKLVPRKFGATAPGAGRVVAQHGPSGSDFEIGRDDQPFQPQRSVFRL